MSTPSPLVDAYRPPETDAGLSHGPDGAGPMPAHVLAGTLLVAVAVVHGASLVVRWALHVSNSWWGPANTGMYLLLGLGLRRSSSRVLRSFSLTWLTLAMGWMIAPRLAKLVHTIGLGPTALVASAGVFLSAGLRLLPFFLLLLGTPGRSRRRWAIGLVVLALALEILSAFAAIQAGRGLGP